jgi:hypothetical protein
MIRNLSNEILNDNYYYMILYINIYTNISIFFTVIFYIFIHLNSL